MGLEHLLRAHSIFYIKFGDEEQMLMDNIKSLIKTLGQMVSGDEKLFRFTGLHGFVQQCINKPARIGIWHYQCVALLPNSLPFLCISRGHNANGKRGQHITTNEVMNTWFDLAVEKNRNAVIFSASYYLSAAARKSSNDKNINLIAAVNPSRMNLLHRFVSRKVREAGEFCVAYNKNTNEAVTYHWNEDTHICLLYTSPSPRDATLSRMPSSA